MLQPFGSLLVTGRILGRVLAAETEKVPIDHKVDIL